MQLMSQKDFYERINALPFLRPPRNIIDPLKTVIACHISNIEEAKQFYRDRYKVLPEFYVYDMTEAERERWSQLLKVRHIGDLSPDMDIQVYLPVATAPRFTAFHKIVAKLAAKGIERYCFEEISLSKLYRYKKCYEFTNSEVQTICFIHNALHDATSRLVFLSACKARMTGQPGYIQLSSYPCYFHPEIPFKQGDVLCEGGIDNANSTAQFVDAVGSEGKIFAFEPVAENYEKSLQITSQYDNITLIPQALWDHTGHLYMRVNAQTFNAAHVAQTPDTQARRVDCTCIDDFFANKDRLDHIKLDIEGAELPALLGAHNTLKRLRPALEVAVYHVGGGLDLLNVPRYLMELDAGYRFYMGHHSAWYAETDIYAAVE